MALSPWLEVGVVSRPHGLRGELKVHLHWRESHALERGRRVALSAGERQRDFTVSAARRTPTHSLVELEGVDDRTAAEAWRGAKLLVLREDLGSLQPGEYYLQDLLDAEVFGPEGRIGRVVALACYPTADAVIVELPDGSRREQPLLEPWLLRVDAQARRIELASLEGLL